MRHLFADSAEHIVLIPPPVLACLGSHRDRGPGLLLAPLRPSGIRALLVWRSQSLGRASVHQIEWRKPLPAVAGSLPHRVQVPLPAWGTRAGRAWGKS